jgi:hypothetical protein
MKVTYQTFTLADAGRGIRIYNHGLYGYVKNPDLDDRARQMFDSGLGYTNQDILRQGVHRQRLRRRGWLQGCTFACTRHYS